MESSPLTLAHSHARNALSETRKSNPVAASEEHDLAAGEFATAAQKSLDPAALRTLQLLEHHHQRLAEILRFKHEHQSTATQPDPAGSASAVPVETTSPESRSPNAPLTDRMLSPEAIQQHQPPRLTASGRARQSDPASIASRLATARGIPSHPPRANPASPTLSAQNADAKMTPSPAHNKHLDSAHTGSQNQRAREFASENISTHSPDPRPGETRQQESLPSDTNGTALAGLRSLANDESFQRFYSTFEGIISKLSAPLAFASLPLGTDPSAHQRRQSGQKSGAEAKLDRQSAAADRSNYSQNNPDVNKLVSSAALRAIKDKNGSVPSGNVAESFYVVPTAGGMISYAGILSRAEKEAQKEQLDDNEDDFVDAREEQSSPETLRGSMRGSKSGKKAAANTTPGMKTLEELQMENNALKQLSDTLSKRLHMWEVNAQSSSMALHQSLRAMQGQPVASPPVNPNSPTASAGPDVSAPSNTEMDSRVRELEEMVQRGEKELERVERENEKLKNVVGRYRERWEKLKEGARVRRDGNGNGDGSSKSPDQTPTLEDHDLDSKQ